jgi:hypothetical protein
MDDPDGSGRTVYEFNVYRGAVGEGQRIGTALWHEGGRVVMDVPGLTDAEYTDVSTLVGRAMGATDAATQNVIRDDAGRPLGPSALAARDREVTTAVLINLAVRHPDTLRALLFEVEDAGETDKVEFLATLLAWAEERTADLGGGR